MLQGALGAQGVVPTNEAIVGIAQQECGAQVSWLMIIGFIVALVLARITPLHYVFLTGHHILFMATMITIVMASAGMSTWLVIGLGAVLLMNSFSYKMLFLYKFGLIRVIFNLFS